MLRRAIGRLLVWTGRLPGGLWCSRRLYDLATFVAALMLRGRGVLAVYVRGSVARGNATPGLSDIDLHVITDDLDGDDGSDLTRRITEQCRRVERVLPMAHAFVNARTDNDAAIRAGALYYANPRIEWKRCLGQDVLPDVTTPPERLVVSQTRLLLRRFFGIQKRLFAVDPARSRRVLKKVNPNLLLDGGHLLHFLRQGHVAPVDASVRDLARSLDDPDFDALVRLDEEVRRCGHHVDAAEYFGKMFDALWGLNRSAFATIDTAAVAAASPTFEVQESVRSISCATRAVVRASLEPVVDRLRTATEDFERAIVLSSIPVRNYGHKLYLVVPDDMPIDRVKRLRAIVHASLREDRTVFPSAYFSTYPAPLLVSESMFRGAAIGQSCGFEPAYVRRHGIVFANSLGRVACEMDETASLASVLTEGYTHLGFARRRRDLLGAGPKLSTDLLDYVTGTVPALRLLLGQGIVVTTPAEACAEYEARIGGDYARTLASLNEAWIGADSVTLQHDELMAWYRTHFAGIQREATTITRLLLDRWDPKSCGARSTGSNLGRTPSLVRA